MKTLILSGLAGVALLGSTTTNESAPAADDTMGSVKGQVTFEGKRPEPLPPLTIGAKESEGCCDPSKTVDPTDRSLLIDEKGGIANVVVTLTVKGQDPEVNERPVVLDQSECRFEPHVVLVPVGGEIEYKNSDSVNHNVHSYAKKNQPVNNNVAGGASDSQKLEKAEVFEVKCDIHPWMLSNVYVYDATFATVTGPDGSYSLEGVPAGSYKLEYWHAKLGKGKTDEITVAAGAAADGSFTMGEAKKKGGRRR